MTAPTKAPAAKVTALPVNGSEKAKRTRAPRVDIDFTSITPGTAETLDRTREGANRLDGTPIRDWVKNSWANAKPEMAVRNGADVEIKAGSIVTVPVPSAGASQVKRMIRDAAAEGGVTARFGKDKVAGDVTTISFQAVTKVTRPKKDK